MWRHRASPLTMSSGTAPAKPLHRLDSNRSAVVLGGVAVLLGIISTFALARLLDTDEFGRYALFVAAIRLLVLPAEAGLPQLITREMNRGESASVIAWSRRVLVVTWLTLVAGLFIVEHFFRSGITSQTWLIAAAVGAMGVLFLCRGILLGERQTIPALLPDSVLRPAVLIAIVLVVAVGGGLDGRVAEVAYVVAVVVALCVALGLVRRLHQPPAERPHVQLGNRTLFRALVPLTLIKGVRVVNRRVEVLVLGAFALAADVAIYNVALQLTGLILLAQTMVNARLSPHIARATRDAPEDVPQLVAGAVKISMAFAAAAFVGLVVLGRPALGLLGSDFRDSYPLALVLGAANALSVAFGPTSMLLNMSDHAEDSFRSGLAAAVANIALMFALIPWLGASGAALSAATVIILIQVQRWFLVRRRLGVRPDVIAAFRR